MSWIEKAFASLPDPRTANAKRHALLRVLVMALTAWICGAESCSDFADFAVDREDLFREFLRLEHGVPSHDTFSRTFRLLDPSVFGSCFGRFADVIGGAGEGVIAIDGKTLRRSFDDAAQANPLAVVTVFGTSARVVIGQLSFRAADGDSEILAARALLRCLDLEGRLVTADAIHCQVETAQLIRDRGGDYLLPLKANHPVLYEMVASYSGVPDVRTGLATAETTDGDHGRIETRRAWVSHDLNWMRGPKSSRALDPKSYLDAARSHWAVENGLHWVLDVVFDEDRARNRKDHGPENLATLPKLALNILNRSRPEISVRRKRKPSGWSNDFARSITGQMR